MYGQPYGPVPPQFRPPQQAYRRRRKQARRRKFNWAIVLVPAAVLILLWIISGIEPSGTWDDVMDFLNVKSREKYTLLMCLCLVCVAIIWIARIFRKDSKDET